MYTYRAFIFNIDDKIDQQTVNCTISIHYNEPVDYAPTVCDRGEADPALAGADVERNVEEFRNQFLGTLVVETTQLTGTLTAPATTTTVETTVTTTVTSTTATTVDEGTTAVGGTTTTIGGTAIAATIEG